MGVDVDCTNEQLQTPMLLASEKGHLETLRVLVRPLIPHTRKGVRLRACACARRSSHLHRPCPGRP